MTTTTTTIGYLASTLVLMTFATNDLRRLRVIAILSNLAFIAYGGLAWLPPVLGLHLLLLPLNVVRLVELRKAARDLADASLRRGMLWGSGAMAAVLAGLLILFLTRDLAFGTRLEDAAKQEAERLAAIAASERQAAKTAGNDAERQVAAERGSVEAARKEAEPQAAEGETKEAEREAEEAAREKADRKAAEVDRKEGERKAVDVARKRVALMPAGPAATRRSNRLRNQERGTAARPTNKQRHLVIPMGSSSIVVLEPP
jgi:hypothetical protein